MSRYLSLSGSFICSEEQLDIIRNAINQFVNRAAEFWISPEQARLYLKGWNFPDEHFNWLRYVFFGGDIQVYAEKYLINQILSVIRDLNASSLEDKSIDGMFYYDEEEGERGYWIVNNKGVHCYVIDGADAEGRIATDANIVARLKKQFIDQI
jgi:hypothetical protein